MPSAVDVALEFVSRINAHEPEAILALCAPSHRFIDSLGSVLAGHENLLRGWSGYFALFPDYTIEVEGSAVADSIVLLYGWAAGSRGATRSGTAWRIPAAWRAVVAGRLVQEWQVYADNKPVYELLARDA